jgi:hypothetical protein
MGHIQKRRTDVRQLKENANMNSKLRRGMNEICALSAVELDAVSGGAYKQAFRFTVAGMHVSGNYDDQTGEYNVGVNYDGKFIVQGGKV